MTSLKRENIIVLDIETVSSKPTLEDCDTRAQELRAQKAEYQTKSNETPSQLYIQKAGIFAEFGKIICISVGKYVPVSDKPNEYTLEIKSFADHDEKKLLQGFLENLKTRCDKSDTILCAHNGKEFDFPWIGRKLLIHGLPLPHAFQLQNKKAREVPHIDTMNLWSFGDYKNFTKLDTLAYLFGIPSPKDDISGKEVSAVYRSTQDLARIQLYCEKDVKTTALLLPKLLQSPISIVI
jgi:DNA polymerase elongation subunit (family B)